MAQDFISSMLYSCGHFEDNHTSWSMGNYPCTSCKRKGVENIGKTTFDPGYTRLHYDRTFWGKRKNTGTWERVERPADWKEKLTESLRHFHQEESWFGTWPPELRGKK